MTEYTRFFSKSGNIKVRSLSNFSNLPVSINGIDCITGEHYFHCFKYILCSNLYSNSNKRKYELLDYSLKFIGDDTKFKTPFEAKKNGGKSGLKLIESEIEYWNSISERIQNDICDYKIKHYEDVQNILVETKNTVLIHQDNRASSKTIWGARVKDNEIIGQNKLGKIWMKMRKSLYLE
tara:strand:- start:421 stop:957 length:537 start_codon:yes stop_codon:yes gene_type:complete